MRLNGRRQHTLCLLQVHEGRLHHLHHMFGHPPPGYNHHGGVRTSITLCLGCVSFYVAIDLYLGVVVNLNHDYANMGVDINLDLDPDVPNGGFRYQKAAQGAAFTNPYAEGLWGLESPILAVDMSEVFDIITIQCRKLKIEKQGAGYRELSQL